MYEILSLVYSYNIYIVIHHSYLLVVILFCHKIQSFHFPICASIGSANSMLFKFICYCRGTKIFSRVLICPKYLDVYKGESGLFNISVLSKEAFKGVKTINFSFTSKINYQGLDDSSDVYDFSLNCTFEDTTTAYSPINLYLMIIIKVLVVCTIFFYGKYRKYW